MINKQTKKATNKEIGKGTNKETSCSKKVSKAFSEIDVNKEKANPISGGGGATKEKVGKENDISKEGEDPLALFEFKSKQNEPKTGTSKKIIPKEVP